jgi:hypothetical protein
MSARIKQLERIRLSDGGLAIVDRLGKTYSFTRTYDSLEQAPDVTPNLTHKQAYTQLADMLRRDVLELDL